MSIIKEKIYAGEGFSADEVTLFSFICSNPDKKDDPIDRAIVTAYEDSPGAQTLLKTGHYEQQHLVGFNPEVKRTVAFVTHNGGKVITIAKGLPAKIIDTSNGGVDSHEIQWKVHNAGDQAFINEITDTDQSLSKAGYKVRPLVQFVVAEARIH